MAVRRERRVARARAKARRTGAGRAPDRREPRPWGARTALRALWRSPAPSRPSSSSGARPIAAGVPGRRRGPGIGRGRWLGGCKGLLLGGGEAPAGADLRGQTPGLAREAGRARGVCPTGAYGSKQKQEVGAGRGGRAHNYRVHPLSRTCSLSSPAQPRAAASIRHLRDLVERHIRLLPGVGTAITRGKVAGLKTECCCHAVRSPGAPQLLTGRSRPQPWGACFPRRCAHDTLKP